MYTSGTTGHPKGVVSTHRNITSALNMLAVFSLIKDALDAAKHAAAGSAPPTPAQQCALLAIPLFHVTATHAVLLPCFYFGRKMVIMCVLRSAVVRF
jgi:long-chain acyl-CoA synthetase